MEGELQGPAGRVQVTLEPAGAHTLYVEFGPGAPLPPNRAEFEAVSFRASGKEVQLGRCRYHSHEANPARRREDPPMQGHGKIVFLEDVYDFSALARTGLASELSRRLEQLPVLWGRKKEILPTFRDFVAELVYDLQVYRAVFDEIDRNLGAEAYPIREDVYRVVARSEYGPFCELFDRKLEELEAQVRAFSKEEHERHGFYLRKHVWDFIRASEFLLRTNLKPRGYAGDSAMMRMLYENDFRGSTIFARFVHRHPVQSAAAQAVRNRLVLLSDRIGAALKAHRGEGPLKVISVAAGPAWELREVLRAPEDFHRLEFTLLDQDLEAHAEAKAMLGRLEAAHREKAKVRFIQDSVRTMLRTPDLPGRWGRFHFLYSMGLFDYLTAPVAKVVLERLYDLLEPGGELVIGNFHVRNPTRLYMEYWMDWVLLYRTEDDLLELAAGLPGAHARIDFETTGSQMFLTVRKEA